ncbi:MAG: helix-turn-helix transcriptional regulator [Clostridiales bacterium]|nr:helix-turn-helix transcriptional regulator [Clostridiales bacterium]
MPLISSSFCEEIINSLSIEILISGYQRAGTEWSKSRFIPPHYSKLYFILGGDAFIYYNGIRHELRAGNVYLIPTDLVYDNGCESCIDFLYFNIRLTNKSGYDFLASYTEMLECEYSTDKTRELISEYTSDDLSKVLYLKAELLNIVLKLLATAPQVHLTNKIYSQSVSRALEYIHSNLSIRLSIDEICQNIYTARSTLNKRFHNEVGTSIGTYIDTEILTRCEQLLVDTDIPISQISERFGFCDQFYFSRKFKSKYGQTPQKYRRDMR